jgi:hypothetical protein
MFSFIITSRNGTVLDFGTYHDEQCARDTGNDSPRRNGNILTIVDHDDDGNVNILD